ncbi:hypothetical protein SEMRO_3069_G343150.1 [Seminavis robusta]|uniref:Uncharacterized protein n=1 Tax=Seminavis robusta TaxID=568900 RepID=A0A9N8F3R2_9STRA|nr:hypothetical protein SEMRO_3069_G343150.1 [Seminavis robusta]|eukprot:Sro3069_g343150.1 n/a (322) ;mRNA; f:7149-8114
MEWHFKECGKLAEHQSLGECKEFISRKKLMKKLKTRYNMGKKYAQPIEKVLPHTKSKVKIYRRHARDLVESLLTDPRWKDEDWLFFDNENGEPDPFAPPPNDLKQIGDLNTGLAYRETYKKLITKPDKQILVPLPLYIDGAVTGQFDKLQVTALKISLGILNRRARDKEHSWRALGLVSNYTKEDSRGQKIFTESGHVAAEDAAREANANDQAAGQYTGKEGDPDKAADYHFILEELLKSVDELIKEGMVMDIRYKANFTRTVSSSSLSPSSNVMGMRVTSCAFPFGPEAKTSNSCAGTVNVQMTEPMIQRQSSHIRRNQC